MFSRGLGGVVFLNLGVMLCMAGGMVSATLGHVGLLPTLRGFIGSSPDLHDFL